MLNHLIRALLVSSLLGTAAHAATVYAIDIDTTRVGGADTSGPLATESGWTSLDATNPASSNGASVTIDGVNFSIASADGSRVRHTGGSLSPNDLTGDFVFDDGAGQAVLLLFGGAGDLQAGTWQVEMWAWDETSPIGGDLIAAYRTNNAETIVTSTATPDPVNPAAVFTFESDGASTYDVFFRENNANNRARLNAVRLTLIPEPSSALLMLGGLGTFLLRRRR